MKEPFKEGIHLFNTHKFFEAHEALEALWLKTDGREKLFLHGLIQIAAAFHHHVRHNPAGFRSLLNKGLKKLDSFGAVHRGIDLGDLRRELQDWREFLNRTTPSGKPAPVLPYIRRPSPH